MQLKSNLLYTFVTSLIIAMVVIFAQNLLVSHGYYMHMFYADMVGISNFELISCFLLTWFAAMFIMVKRNSVGTNYTSIVLVSFVSSVVISLLSLVVVGLFLTFLPR